MGDLHSDISRQDHLFKSFGNVGFYLYTLNDLLLLSGKKSIPVKTHRGHKAAVK